MKKLNLICSVILLLVLANINQVLAASKYDYTIYTSKNYVQNRVVQQTHSDIIEFVMDYSGSMSSWINTAKYTFQSILPQVPQNTEVGLRIFGPTNNNVIKTYRTITKSKNEDIIVQSVQRNSNSSCTATQALVTPQANNPSNLISSMSSVSVGGVTPLTYALQETVSKDFAGKSYSLKKKIILITDGGENCNGNPCEFIRNLVRTRRDITIDVIMLGSDRSLKCLADNSGGNYYNVRSGSDFKYVLGETLEVTPLSNNKNQQPQNMSTPIQNNGYGYHAITD